MPFRRVTQVIAGLFVLISAAIAPLNAQATVSILRAELAGARLHIEGQAIPNATITVDGTAMGVSDAAGLFIIERDPFTSADCLVDVNDGSPIATPAKLTGCTVAPPPTAGSSGFISIVRGGNGHGMISSQPAGIDCPITDPGGAGICTGQYPAGTIVRLDAFPAGDSTFLGWRALPGCRDPQKILVFADIVISCQPVFALR